MEESAKRFARLIFIGGGGEERREKSEGST